MEARDQDTQSERRTQRLDARVTSTDKELIERAASISGNTLTGFVVSTLRRTAHEVIRSHEEMQLTERDRETLVAALLEEDPQPAEAMVRAARAHDAYTGRR